MRALTRHWIAAAACLLAIGTTHTVVVAQEAKESPSSIKEIAPDDTEYRFLRLGVERNYLKAERWRIIDQIEQAIPAIY